MALRIGNYATDTFGFTVGIEYTVVGAVQQQMATKRYIISNFFENFFTFTTILLNLTKYIRMFFYRPRSVNRKINTVKPISKQSYKNRWPIGNVLGFILC